MKAFVTSIGEPTTDLCVWSLERNGFDVEILLDKSTLAEKLAQIYKIANADFIRIDADIIVNRNLTPDLLYMLANEDDDIWWWQFTAFDWYKQDLAHCMAYIRPQALPALRANIGRFKDHIRPETEISRIQDLYNPRRMATYKEEIMGIHGYGIKDTKPVMKLKASRGQSHLYDFELSSELDRL